MPATSECADLNSRKRAICTQITAQPMSWQGRDHVIRFRGDPLRMVSDWVHEYERFWTEHLDNLEQFFKNKRKAKKS